MELDWEIQQYYNRLRDQLGPVALPGVDGRRERLRETTALLGDTRPSALDVADITIPLEGRTLAARVYRPHAVAQPALGVFFHGGGWVVGDLDTHDGVAARLADGLRCAIVSVDYRRAPEHPYPAAVEDAISAIAWLAEQRRALGLAADTLAVIGDSAGGYLAARASIALNARMRGYIDAQLLLYPMIDHNEARASYADNAGKPGISANDIRYYWETFLAGQATSDDSRVTLLSQSDRELAPATLVAVAQCDPLRDEGRDYAALLERDGVRVQLLEAQRMPHGFMRLHRAAAAARRWSDEVIAQFAQLWPHA